MSWIDFQYVKTGTGELSGPSFVAQTEQAVNELGGFINTIENTAADAAAAAAAAQQAAGAAQQTANSAVSQAQAAQSAAESAQQSAEQAQAAADSAAAAAQAAQTTANSKAPIMHAAGEVTYGAGTDVLYGHVQLSDATTGTEQAANGGTAATPYAVAQVSSVASAAQNTAQNAQQVADSAQQSANAAQSTATAAQNTANAVQTELAQSVDNLNQQIAALTQQYDFIVTTSAIDTEDYAGSFARLYLTTSASASTGLPAGITFPCYFWAERDSDGKTSMMYVLSSNVLYSQTGTNTTPEADTHTWSMSGWTQITYSAATTSSLGVVKPDGATVNVSSGVLSVPVYTGATASAAGTAGLVPPAAAAQQRYVLQGDGTWLNVQGASAHASMPGSQAVNISLDTNPFTPPTDGWIQYKAVTSVGNSWISLTCSTGLYVSTFSPLAVSNLGIFIPIAANATVSFSSSDTSTFTSRTATFYYAQGAQS